MKIEETPEEYKDLILFACRVCRIKNNSCRVKKGDCAYRAIAKEYCPEIEQGIAQTEKEKISTYQICAACGKDYSGEETNGHLCYNCKKELENDR